MDYITLLFVLVIIAVILAIGIIVALIVGSIKQRAYDREEEYDDDDDDDYDDRRPVQRRRRPSREEEDEDEEEDEEDEDEEDEDEEEEYVRRAPAAPVKKQWKLILENLDTWEKSSIIFYDNIGIGRKCEDSEFEKYYAIKDDPRVSKLHCAIISSAGKLYLKDIGSSNGTYLNGKKISQPVVLQKEDIIGIGQTQIEIKKVLKEK